jgi:hypothetical protein
MCAELAVSQGSKTAQNKNEKIRATSDVFKVECCGSFLPTSNRKNEVEKKVDDFLTKSQAESALKVVVNEVDTAKFRTKYHLRRGKRE